MATHPLDSLSADEIRRTSTILGSEKNIDNGWRYASIMLAEPAKALVKAWREGDPIPRRSLSVLWQKATNDVYEAVVDLVAGAVESWTHRPGVCPNFTLDEYHEIDHALRSHPQVVAALQARGITDLDLVLFDTWTYGEAVMPPQWQDRRLGWVDIWLRGAHGGNPYAHPVSGLKVVVDMNTEEVLEIEDHHDLGLPEVAGDYIPEMIGTEVRTDLKPLHINQPEGVSFTIDGTLLRWQNWTMRLGFNWREGPVIYQVSFDDHGVERDIAYRMSFAEMIVPYRDSGFDHYRRTAYDIGEWGLGYMTTSLELGCDCLGEIRYLDAVLPDSKGQPWEIKNAICLHEEDNAVLWKHVDEQSGAEVRRMRRMVVSVHATVANYEYLVYWRFYQDGNIECEVRATGIMVTSPLPEGETSPTGTMVDRRTYAPYHQHFLVARLDLDIDGENNSVVESDSFAPPISASNPMGLDLNVRSTVIASEAESGRDYNWNTQRGWKVTNPGKLNAHGNPVAYKLVPSASFPHMMDESSPVFLRNPVVGHQLWVTRHDETELWPAGEYPTQSGAGGGIVDWVADDAPLVDTDVVLWHVFGIHHITRVEDWPVMPADTVAWWLKPFGFFDRNPSLDAPRSAKSASCGSPAAAGDCCSSDAHGH
ncbi:MAG: primary-amine oxidase [Micropruina sp.]|nr:primary-amine oxidase [Micropruina sp.]